MQVNQFLENSAAQFPNKEAVWYKDEWMSFITLETLANKLANYLKEIGIRRGERVAILYENCFNYIIAYYAILKAGGVTVALNTETTTDSLAYLLYDSGARAIITNARFSKYVVPAIKRTPDVKHVIISQDDLSEYELIGHCSQVRLNDIYNSGNPEHPAVRCIDIDLASIVYTSGSTGKPKGVTLTHLNIVTNTRSIVSYLQLTPQDRIMVVLPFYYIYGKSLLNTHFFVGGSVVIDNMFAYPNVVLKNIIKTEATGFSGVPSTFSILLNSSNVRKLKFASLRYITQAGGAMAPTLQQEVAAVFAPAKLFIMYGATEASARLSYMDPEALPRKWGSIGKAIPNVDLFVADDRGNELPTGEIGEIVGRGANLMVGYWNDPLETAQVLRNGLYYTGDLGRMDEEGYLYVVGRKKDMIKVGGERVSAKEVEEVILEIDKVHEVAVIGVDDATLGEAIKAFIVPRADAILSSEEVMVYLRGRLPHYKNPKYIEICTALPKNESGKILKAVLREQQKNN
ncbi:MAG TPA: class I adenylate-forming enzyme family protein [bacterium]|nr:class I adenylate-forming enzyme family protein [bacterium]HPN45600.1 class I adenylate-forming enzyme family protein [bacterium]